MFGVCISSHDYFNFIDCRGEVSCDHVHNSDLENFNSKVTNVEHVVKLKTGLSKSVMSYHVS